MDNFLARVGLACDAAAGLVIFLYPVAVDRLTQLHNKKSMSLVHDSRA